MSRFADEHITRMMGMYLFEHRYTSVKAVHLLTFFLSGTGLYTFLHSLAPAGSPLLSPAVLLAICLCVWALYLDVLIGLAFCCFVGLQLFVAMHAVAAFASPGAPFWGGFLITATGLLLEGAAHFAIQKGPPAIPAQLTAVLSPLETLGLTLYFVFTFGSFFIFCEVATLLGYRPELRARYIDTLHSYQKEHDAFVAALAAR